MLRRLFRATWPAHREGARRQDAYADYVDLRVYSPRPLDDSQLQRLGQLAAAEEDRPIRIRRWEECLSQAVDIAGNSESQQLSRPAAS
jgi:hypothetical protein